MVDLNLNYSIGLNEINLYFYLSIYYLFQMIFFINPYFS